MKAKIEAEYGRVKVIVKTLTDMWICGGIELSDTMDELEAKIQSAYCIPPDKQHVFFWTRFSKQLRTGPGLARMGEHPRRDMS